MTITATIPLSEGSKCYGSFTFSDGATVRVSGGLICSQHGRRHCRHHKLAHEAIITKAASQKAATAAVEPDFPLLMNVEVEVAIATAQMEAEGFSWSDEAQTWVRATEAAIEAAETFGADYDAWLDSLPAGQPTPEDFAVEAA